MINWSDEGVIIDFRRHGETSAIIEVFTHSHGRHLGVMKGGGSRAKSPQLQPGCLSKVEYSARLEEHLGRFRLEAVRNFTASLMSDPLKLLSFQSICALIKFAMVERDPHPNLYVNLQQWLQSENYLAEYARFELELLSEAGFQLDLMRCAVTGRIDNLQFVSPKSGRAISKEAAGEWADRLLPYSTIFAGDDGGNIQSALKTTGHFLTDWLAPMNGRYELPKARERLLKKVDTITNL